ncbi:MAG TPA: hypothetical protein VI356_05095 [Myxococcales bacterium]
MILCDVDGQNVAALKARTAEYGPRVTIVPGDCNEVMQGAIESIAAPIRNTKNGLLYHLVHASKKGEGRRHLEQRDEDRQQRPDFSLVAGSTPPPIRGQLRREHRGGVVSAF